MTRNQRQGGRTTTYDLSDPRNVAAFEALLDEEEDEAEGQQQQQKGGRKADAQQQQQQRQRRERERFFKLRDDAPATRGPAAARPVPAQHQQQQLDQLLELFGGSADPGVVADVLSGTGGDLQAATEALLGMLGGAGAGGGSGAPAAAGSGAGSSRAAAAAAGSGSAAAAAGCFAWVDLPADVKHAVLAQLAPRDLARAAAACRELSDRARGMRRAVRRLVLPPGVSYGAAAGMVAGHPSACVVDFSRLERHISRVDAAELPPQVAAARRQEAEAQLFKSLVAVAEGSGAAARAERPIRGLVLRGLVGTTDRVLAEALQSLHGLRSLDLSHCPSLTNKSLHLVTKYRATAVSSAAEPGGSEGAEDGSEGAEDGSEGAEDGSEGAEEEWEAAQGRYTPSGSGSEGADSSGGEEGGGEGESGQEEEEEAGGGPAVPEANGGSGGRGAPAGGAAGAVEAAAAESPAAASHAGAARPVAHSPATSSPSSAVAARLSRLQLRSHEQAAAAAAAAASAAATAAGVQELCLAGGRAWEDEGLRQVLQGPNTKHSLQRLDVSGCKGISQAGLVVPPLGVLRELRASRVQGLTQLVLHLPAGHPLARLDLSCCHYLQKVDLALGGLRELNLSACRTLYRLRVRCPTLRVLSAPQCGMLREFHQDAWAVPALRQLNLFGCRRASGVQLQAVLQGLTELRRLCLNGCWAVASLHLNDNLLLESVDISGCRSLLAFSASSPCLTELAAAACGRLHSLTLASGSLRTLQLANCGSLSEVHVAPAHAGGAAAAAGGARRGGGTGRRAACAAGGLNLSGCVALSPPSRARLAAAVLAVG